MRGRAVEVEVTLLYVFAVVAFVAGESEQPLLQDGIAAVPQSDSAKQMRWWRSQMPARPSSFQR